MFDFCPIIRWKLSEALNNEAALSDPLQQHIEHCEACRHFYQANLSLLANPDLSRPAPNRERRKGIMDAVRKAAETRPCTSSIAWERARLAVPALAGCAAVFLLVIWLSQPPAPDEAPPVASPQLETSFPGAVNQAAESLYAMEMAKMQRDLIRGALFLREAAQPTEILDLE